MRILLTGHHGYIGSVLLPRLLERGHEVRGLDCDYFASCRVERAVDCPGRWADIRDATRADLAGCDTVIHLAGLSNDPLGDLDPALTEAINTAASLRLYRLAAEAGVRRFVFASTCAVYGGAGEAWCDESSPTAPLTVYARSKLRVEEALREADGPDWVCLRLATLYGPSPYLRFDLVLNNLVAYAISQGHILLKSDGHAWRPLLHVADAGRAFQHAAEAPAEAVRGHIFNVGSRAENFRVVDIARLVAAAVPTAPLRFAPDGGRDARSYRVDGSAFAAAVDFRPAWSAAQGAVELAERYRALGIGPEAFEGARYSRIGHLRALREAGRLDAEGRWA